MGGLWGYDVTGFAVTVSIGRHRSAESPAGTTVPPAASLNASPTAGAAGSGNVLTISGGTILNNGSLVPGGSNGVTELYYIGHTAFQFNGSNWFGPIIASGSGSGLADPRPTISVSSLSVAAAPPSGTVVGAISVAVGAGSYSWTYSLSGTDAASFSISGSNLLTNGALSSRSYAINIIASNGTILGSPFIKAFSVTVGASIPAPAQSAGYTTRVLYDNFQANSVAAANGSYTPGPGSPTFPNWWIQSNSGATTSQVFVANGLLNFVNANNNDSAQAQLATTRLGVLPNTSTPTSIASNTGNGLGFGYGYFKAVMAYSPSGGGGWPAFWMTNLVNPAVWPNAAVPAHIEIDILEYEAGAPNATVWQWGQSPVTYQYNIASKYAGGAQSALTTPSGWDVTRMNAYGCLWTPTGIGFYLNDVLVSYVASSLKPFNPLPLPDGNFPSGIITNWPSGVLGCGVVLGAGSSWNVTVSSVEVWQ